MDICMLTPSQRQELQAHLAEYETVKETLLIFLKQVEREWTAEVEEEPHSFFDTERMVLPIARLNVIQRWIGELEINVMDSEELEIYVE